MLRRHRRQCGASILHRRRGWGVSRSHSSPVLSFSVWPVMNAASSLVRNDSKRGPDRVKRNPRQALPPPRISPAFNPGYARSSASPIIA